MNPEVLDVGGHPVLVDWSEEPTDQDRDELRQLLLFGNDRGELDLESGSTYSVDTEQPEPLQACRVCGCTEINACPPTCWWVEPDLCSSCAGDSPERTDRA